MKLACGRFRVDGRGAESRSKTWGARSRVTSPSTDGVGAESEPRNRAKQPRLHRWLLTARLREFEREREQAAVEQGLVLRKKRLFRRGGTRDASCGLKIPVRTKLKSGELAVRY